MDIIKHGITTFNPWTFFKQHLIKKCHKRSAIMPGNGCEESSKAPELPLELSPADLLRKAEEELQEKPEWRERDIQALRDLVLGDEDLVAPTDDAFLLRFLRARKFDYDRAHQLIQQYYRIRLEYPDLYENYQPSKVLNAFEDSMQLVLPEPDQRGRRVFIFRAGKWNPELCTLDDIFKANQFCLEKTIQEEVAQINGFVAIVDMKDVGMQHIKQLRPAYAKKVVSLIQDCFPARFKGFHFTNEPAVFEMIFALVKPFLSEKLNARLYFHGANMESLHQHITPEILPEEFGGKRSAMDNSSFVKTLVACDDEFCESMKYGYKQVPVDKTISNVHMVDGIAGTFYRKICID